MTKDLPKNLLKVKVLRMVTSFGSAHMFFPLGKQWFKHACAGVDIDAINHSMPPST